MAAGEYDVPIEAGIDWEHTLYLKDDAGSPKDLTGYSAEMKIRETMEGDVIETLSTSGGEIVITAAQGKILLKLTDLETAALGIKEGVYDLVLTDSGTTKTKLLKGKVIVDPLVTRT